MNDAPLDIEPGVYYRLHPSGRPFSREDASTRNIGEPPHPDLAKYWEPKRGYSAFWNPHHLDQYLSRDFRGMSWGNGHPGSRVYVFRGTPVGEGADGEPRVMPYDDRPLGVMTLAQFRRRLEITDDGYGVWYEHHWDDGPDGPQVDDQAQALYG